MSLSSTNCQICSKNMNSVLGRYLKNIVCNRCVLQAVDEMSNQVVFSNESIGGGIIRTITKNNCIETDNSSICYIKGIKCKATEGKYGGIVYVVY